MAHYNHFTGFSFCHRLAISVRAAKANKNIIPFFEVIIGTMKKLILIFSLILLTTFSYSQLYKTVKIDTLITVSLPAVYTKKDSSGQQTFTARANYGFIVVTRIANAANNAPLKKESDLNKVFKNYVKDVQQVGNGTIENERDTLIGTVKGHLFTLKTEDDNGDVQYRNFLFIYSRDASYTFQYFYKEAQLDLASADTKPFYSSIKFNPELQRNDQYLVATTPGMPAGLKTLLYGGGGLVVVLVIVFTTIRRRKRKLAEA
jgi:hypothetical protein